MIVASGVVMEFGVVVVVGVVTIAVVSVCLGGGRTGTYECKLQTVIESVITCINNLECIGATCKSRWEDDSGTFGGITVYGEECVPGLKVVNIYRSQKSQQLLGQLMCLFSGGSGMGLGPQPK